MYCVPGTVLYTGDIAINKAGSQGIKCYYNLTTVQDSL